jgi:hypothetical protein
MGVNNLLCSYLERAYETQLTHRDGILIILPKMEVSGKPSLDAPMLPD